MVAVITDTATNVTASARIVMITGPPTNAATVNGPPRRKTVILIRPRFPRLLFGERLLGIDRGDATEAHGTAL